MVQQIRSYANFNGLNGGATPDTFNLDAGVYGVTLTAAAWGTATLQRVLKTGSGPAVLVTVLAQFTANGYAVVQLPAGLYQMTIAGVTTLQGAVELICPASG